MRKAMVTRTIKTSVVQFLLVNVETQGVRVDEVRISRAPKDKEKLLKQIKTQRDTDFEKVVSIISISEEQTLLGMDEETFIKNAIKIEKEIKND